MKNFLPKTLLVFAFVSFASIAVAEDDSCSPPPAPQCNESPSYDSCDSCNTCEPCDPCEPCCSEIPLTEEPCNCAYNAPARIDTACGWDAWISGSFLYWQPREKGLDLGYQTVGPHVDATSISTTENPINMDFDFHPAFKLGLGFSSEGDNWTLFLEYTRFYSKDKRTADLGDAVSDYNLLSTSWIDSNLLTQAARTVNNGQYSFLRGEWKLKMNIIDLEVGRPFYLGKKLIFKPHYGLRGGSIDQKYKLTAKYTDVENNDSYVELTSNNNLESWFVGPRAGLDTDWMLGCKFRVFGNVASSLFYQKFTTKIKQMLPEQTLVAEDDVYIDQSKDAISYLTPNLEFEVGFGYGTYFANNEWFFDLTVGYAFHYFWNQNNLRNISDTMDHGSLSDFDAADLMLHGLTLTARLDF